MNPRRAPVAIANAQAVDTRFRTVLNARTSALGCGGCYIDAFSPFPLKSGMSMGLQFTAVEPKQLAVLDNGPAELSGASPPPPHTAAEPNYP